MKSFPATVCAALSALLMVSAGCGTSQRNITTPSGLTYTVLEEGTGPVARAGQHVMIHETTWFSDGRVFYTTRNGRPLRFLLGGGQVIEGVDEGVTGMRVGERRRIIVPPELSRRSSYPEGLSPNDTLHYEVELIGIEPQ